MIVRRPHPALAPFVECVWLSNGRAARHGTDRILPQGTCGLIVNLAEDETRIYDTRDLCRRRVFPGAVVSGPHAEPFVIDTDEQAHAIGVHFKPGGAFPFLGVPLHEIRNVHAPLEAFWARAARELREQLLDAARPDDRLDILEQALIARARVTLHPAVAYAAGEICRAPRRCVVARVTQATGLSARRFIELFTRQVGLTPKLFQRVRRFQHVVKLVHQDGVAAWADLAVASGYCDQPHFIHEFQAFSGLNPSAYLASRGQHPNHVPVGAEPARRSQG